MRTLHYLKRGGAIFIAGLLTVSACGCGAKQAAVSEIMSTQDEINTEMSASEYIEEGITMPDNFENMIYPMEALAVEHYAHGLSYYSESESPESFWFSMAVLSSLMTENDSITPDYEDDYYYYSIEEIDTMASALYQSIASGETTMPEVSEEDSYALFDDEREQYGLLIGSVGNLSIVVTRCDKQENGNLVTTQLIHSETKEVLGEYQFEIVPNPEGKKALFGYSISDMICLSDEDCYMNQQSQRESEAENQGPTIEGDYDEVDGREIVDDSETDSSTEEDVTDTDETEEYIPEKTYLPISREQALNLAKSYMGDDATYSYKQMVTIGDYEYYDFSVSGEDITNTDVLVCITGEDVVAGIQNSDGSWTLDQ